MNLDKHQLCPYCKTPMQLRVPIWVTPGEEYIDTGEVVWDSDAHKDSSNWYCTECFECHFPEEQEDA